MKIIKLKKLTIEEKNKTTFDYKKVIKNILQAPQVGPDGRPQPIYKIDQIRKTIKILDALEESKENLILEESDYQFLKQKVESHKWAIPHKSIVIFVDDIKNAKEKKVKEK